MRSPLFRTISTLATEIALAVSHRGFAVVVTWTAFALLGCSDTPAPSPTVNPQPQHFVKLKVTVEPSEVTGIAVESLWVVGNLGCAPLIYPAGNRRVKQVNTAEKVERVGDYYVATIIMDRFLPDNCRWTNGGIGVKFLHGNEVISRHGAGAAVLQGKRIDTLTCLTKPFANVGVCGMRDEERLYKGEDKRAFNATVELMQ
jgi:hypothetical protein